MNTQSTTTHTNENEGSATLALCRDCGARFSGTKKRCPKCGSPRLLSHPELDLLQIAHIDCDAFFAAVEKRDNPELIDKPVIVGGGKRGVVSTCCYIARLYGVRSAMPMFQAMKACPHAVVIPGRMHEYVKVGRQIQDEMRTLTPLVEPLSIDEAFLDLTGTEKLHHATPAEVLADFVKRMEAEVGITMSVGLAPNKFLAKIASDLDKPKGFSVIGKQEAKEFLATQPTSIIWGVGKVMQKKLATNGIRTVGELQKADPSELAKRYGVMGVRLAKLCQGEDERNVIARQKAKSISNETTFSSDITKYDELRHILWALARKVSDRAKKAELAGSGITLKLKTAEFKSLTRSRHLADPTQLTDVIFRHANELLKNEMPHERHYRLIGVALNNLTTAEQADPTDLVDADAEKRAQAERAMDSLRNRFGSDSIAPGVALKAPRYLKSR
ncbi:DNA polymerase IV [Polycladidibacter stylochi]|uniref:DNA polymerase IV n=1 Tax=Polycladidibacter stylochi TaxID=1807766 RepID=UPI0008312870|nr:DNA polymerase IV [Pseudovibrio stylochi]